MTQAFNLSQFANKLNTSGQTDNTGLQNSSLTVSAGTGMSGGGSVALGSSVTLNNAGVTSITAGTGISVSASTGGVTITNTLPDTLGVTSLNGSTGALKGATLVNTQSYSAASTVDLTTGMTNAGFYQIIYTGSISNSGSTSAWITRVSVNGGSTYASTNYSFINMVNEADVTFSATSLFGNSITQSATSTGFYYIEMLLYTGTASLFSRAFMQSNSTSTVGDYFNPRIYTGTYRTNGQVNGVRLIRSGGSSTLTGSASVYYLGI
jgi:hypothetical protein